MTVDDFHPQARKLYESPGYQRVVRDLKRGKGKNRNTGKRSPGIPGRKLSGFEERKELCREDEEIPAVLKL